MSIPKIYLLLISIFLFTSLHSGEWSLGAGTALPIGHWSDKYKFGLGITAYEMYMVQYKAGISPGFEFWKFIGRKNGSKEEDYTLMKIGPFVDFRYLFVPRRTSVFVQGGVGVYMSQGPLNSGSGSDIRVALRLGGGMKVAHLEFIGMIVLATYNMVTAKLSYILGM